MLRPATIAAALSISCVALLGCPRERDPGYAGQPGYAPGYGQAPPPGYSQPGYPPPGGTAPPPSAGPTPTYPAPGQPAPGQPAPGQPAPGQPAPGQPAPGQPAPSSSWPWPFPLPGQPAPGGSQPAPGQPAPGGGQSGGTATLIDPTMAQAAVIPLNQYAATEAQGMQPATDVIAAQFKQGQTMEQTLQLLPNKCYTVLAVGVGIQEMDIQLIALQPIPGVPNPVLAQDQGSGNQASLGGRGNCFAWRAPFGVNAKAVYTASAGEGVAAGRVYVK